MERERQALLPRLIPPLVHKLNNSLAVLGGATGFVDGQSADVFKRELERVGTTFRHLTLFAKDHQEHNDFFDLGSAVEAVESLVKPLASSIGVDMQFVTPSSPTALRSNPYRLAQLLVALVADEITSVGADHESEFLDPTCVKPQPFVRVAVRQTASRLAFTIVRPTRRSGPPQAPTVLEIAVASAREFALSVSTRTMGGATCIRLVFTTEALAVDPFPAVAPSVANARTNQSLLLIEGDPPLLELMTSILEEAGYAVDALTSTPNTQALLDSKADLILLDANLEQRAAHVFTELQNDDRVRERLLVLGELGNQSGLNGVGVLDKPFRPHELLAAVRARL